MMVHDSAADMHCVSDMHHMNSLNAIDAPVYHVHGAWSRDYGSIQLVWCAHLRLLIAPKEHVPGYLFCLLIDELVAFAWLLAACYFFAFMVAIAMYHLFLTSTQHHCVLLFVNWCLYSRTRTRKNQRLLVLASANHAACSYIPR